MRFNEAVKRNESRFPADFSFRLSAQEVGDLISQFAISSLRPRKHGGRRKPPRVFTEHGAIMAAAVLNSERAIQMSVYVVRAFVEFKKPQDANAKVQLSIAVHADYNRPRSSSWCSCLSVQRRNPVAN